MEGQNLLQKKRLTEAQLEAHNRMIEKHLEMTKRMRTMPYRQQFEYQKQLQSVEDFMEEQGYDFPKHSHRFAPEQVWPEVYGPKEASLDGLSQDQRQHPRGQS
jgi:hypothetical protein